MGMAATTTMSTGVATTVTAMATSITVDPLQLPQLHHLVVALQLQLLLARGTFWPMATLTTATTTTMTPAQHLLQPLQAGVMLLLPPQLHPQVMLSGLSLCCASYQNAVLGILFDGTYQHHHKMSHQASLLQVAANCRFAHAAC